MKNTLVYRNYTQQALDQQYLPTSCTDQDIGHFISTYQRLSHLAYDRLQHQEYNYGVSSDEKIDIFPALAKSSYLHLFIHGGFWRMSDKSDVAFLAPGFVDQGISFAAINYVLAPHGSLADIVEQSRKAIVWLHKQCESLGLGKKLILSGHSAGAHIAMLLAATNWQEYGIKDSVIYGVTGISGLYDLEPLQLSYVNADLKLSADDIEKYSPIKHLPCVECPITLVYGENETDEFKRQTLLFSSLLENRGSRHQCFEVPMKNHFDILFDMTNSDSVLGKSLLD